MRTTNRILAVAMLSTALLASSAAHAGRVHVVIGAGLPLTPYGLPPMVMAPAVPVVPAYGSYGYYAPAQASVYGNYTSTYAQNPDPVYVQLEPPQAPQATWYYCQASKAYYPQVSSCASGWQSIPASPTN